MTAHPQDLGPRELTRLRRLCQGGTITAEDTQYIRASVATLLDTLARQAREIEQLRRAREEVHSGRRI
jgi:hypothetical protein